MQISERCKRTVQIVFVAIECALFLTFIILDLCAINSTPVKYSGIIICFLCALFGAFTFETDGIILAVALIFTAISDLFILVMLKYFEVGLATFIVVQTAYFVRLTLLRGRVSIISAAARVLLFAGIMITLGVTGSLSLLTGEVAFYISMLFCNVAESWFVVATGYKKSGDEGAKNLLFALGLTLFLLCDICVGLHNFEFALGIKIDEGLYNFAVFATWIFYLPSQVLIVLSSRHTPALTYKKGGNMGE